MGISCMYRALCDKYQQFIGVCNKFVITLVVLLLGCSSFCVAQQLMVDDFAKMHNPILGRTPGGEKTGAVINFAVAEEGFLFKVSGEAVASKSGDDELSIVVPKKTPFVEISHPAYGTIYWKVTQKLKRKRVYTARLHSDNPKSEYRISKQWAVVRVDPKDAIVVVDSVFTKMRSGEMQLYLPIGEYPIQISSPFHEPICDTLRLDDRGVLRAHYELRPIYSYIEVVSPDPKARISIGGSKLPEGESRSGRLLAGEYEVRLARAKYRDQSVVVQLGANDRKRVKMAPMVRGENEVAVMNRAGNVAVADSSIVVSDQPKSVVAEKVATKKRVAVVLKAFDEESEALINREVVGRGEWRGELVEGDYYFMSRRDGLESRSIYCDVRGDYPLEMSLPTPLAYYGKLNVSSNVSEAKIYLNGELVGLTPLIIHNLDRDIRYDVELRKEGYKSVTRRVRLSGNAMVGVDLELNREKNDNNK